MTQAQEVESAPMPPVTSVRKQDRWRKWITASLALPTDDNGERMAVVLRRGQDFDVAPESLRTQAYDVARERGYKVETRVVEDRLYLRFTEKAA